MNIYQASLMRDYGNEFERVNGISPKIEYRSGRFYVQTVEGIKPSHFRQSELERALVALSQRPSK